MFLLVVYDKYLEGTIWGNLAYEGCAACAAMPVIIFLWENKRMR